MLLESAKLHRLAYGTRNGDSVEESRIRKTEEALGNVAAPLTAVSTSEDRVGNFEHQELDDKFPRRRKLFQLDLNYRWSSIVFDERFASSSAQKDAYGKLGQDLRAGDRAPDAPSLVILHSKVTSIGKVSGQVGASVRLFDIFEPTVHTALVFAPASDVSLYFGFMSFAV